MAREGVNLTHEQFLATFGWRNDAILRHWLGDDLSSERSERISLQKEERYRELVREQGVTVLPGAAEWVQRLHAEGWAQAVASSAPRANIEVVIASCGLANQFQATSSAEDVQEGKPNPEVFLVAAARLSVAPERSIVVEDAPAGIEAARRGGMRSIAVRRDGQKLPADLQVSSLLDLPPDAFTGLIS